MLKDVDSNREFITTSQAANRANLTTAYITYLLRKGTIEGFQLAREWFIYTDSLDNFLATPRKSGPKGPRAKKPADAPSHAEPKTTRREATR